MFVIPAKRHIVPRELEPRFELCNGLSCRRKSSPPYIMASRFRGTLYTGVTSQLWSRVATHKDGSTPGFTAKYKATTLVWYEHHDTMEAAILRETQIKTWKRAWKIELIESMNSDWLDLHYRITFRPRQN